MLIRMSANQVKQQLTKKLRTMEQFVSAGVMQNQGKEYVLIRLLDKNFNSIQSTIPKKIGDVEIRVEKSEPIVAFGW